MQAIDGSYLYRVGGAIRPLSNISDNTILNDAWLNVYIARSELESFLNGSVFSANVRTSRPAAAALLDVLKDLIKNAENNDTKFNPIGALDAYRLSSSFAAFEAVMGAEFGHMPVFLVTPKKGYDLGTLIYSGSNVFPEDLAAKVPAAIPDINSGTQCMGFELWTAAAFHFHRATESVLRKYWESVLPNRNHPGNKTIGDYLNALGRSRKGPAKLKSALRDLKDLDRNPVLHPEYSLSNVEELDVLMGMIRNAMVQMLKQIPNPAP